MTYPTITNGGLLLYLAVALVLVFLAATCRPGRGIILDPAGHHKNNPTSRITATITAPPGPTQPPTITRRRT